LAARLAGGNWSEVLGTTSLATFILQIALFQRISTLAKILAMYSIVIAGAPIAIWFLHKRRPIALLVLSWCVYTAYEAFPVALLGPLPDYIYFHPLAYQVLFVHALVGGYHVDAIRAWFNESRRAKTLVLSTIGFFILSVIQFTKLHIVPAALLSQPDLWMDRIFGRELFRPGRVLACGVVFPFFYLMTDRLWAPLKRIAGWLFLPLGRHSLYSYVAHIPLAAGMTRVAAHWARLGTVSSNVNAAAQVLVVGIVWALVRLDVFVSLFP
jgi:hypothetical protein